MIGVYDSGVGGLSFYPEIKKAFPRASVVYFADEGNFPYGDKTAEELQEISLKNIKILERFGAKIILVACNSVTVSAISYLRENSNIPIVGVEPAVKVASSATKNGRIGVLATSRTVNSHLNEDLITEGQVVFECPSNELVRLVEEDFDNISDDYLKKALESLEKENVDSIVLGCTHFIFLKKRLEGIFPDISFFEPTEPVVRRMVNVVKELNIVLESDGKDVFLTTGPENIFQDKITKLLGLGEVDVRRIKE